MNNQYPSYPLSQCELLVYCLCLPRTLRPLSSLCWSTVDFPFRRLVLDFHPLAQHV